MGVTCAACAVIKDSCLSHAISFVVSECGGRYRRGGLIDSDALTRFRDMLGMSGIRGRGGDRQVGFCEELPTDAIVQGVLAQTEIMRKNCISRKSMG